MTRSLLTDAFAHHVWATLRVIDVCQTLSAQQLETSVQGIYGPILDTLRHLVGADANYLFVTTEGRVALVDPSAMDLSQLRAEIERHGAEWTVLLAGELDPDRILVRRRDDGSETHAPLGIRLAQALHHGTDHRSQVCTVLTSLGVTPPDIDVWDFGAQHGRVMEKQPAA
jgi:uncharacterized damage-inducible protein DinB